MAVANFDDFCNSLCELVGVEPPRLEPDEQGLVAFTITCEGVDLGFIEGVAGGEPGVMMVADFGAPDETTELQVLREVLETNFLIAGVGAPAFARNPVTGEISLHQSWLLSSAKVQDVYQAMRKTSEAALRWKAGAIEVSNENEEATADQGLASLGFA